MSDDTLGKINEKLNALQIDVAIIKATSQSTEEHVKKLNGSVAENMKQISCVKRDVAVIEERIETIKDNVRENHTAAEKTWDYLKENWLQLVMLVGLLGLVIEHWIP